MFEMFTAISSGGAVLLLGWLAKTVSALQVDVAVIKTQLETFSTPREVKKEKSNAKVLRLRSQ